MKYLVLLGRVLYAAIFILAGPSHFTTQTIAYGASQGVIFPNLLVPISGLIAIFGGLSVALGYKARLGAMLLVVFLVPVTLVMHKFWGLQDPMVAGLQQIMFMKNVSMLGCALLLIYFGPGPYSLSKR